MPTFSGGGGGVSSGSNLQVNSLGVGVAADGVAGDAKINAACIVTGGIQTANNTNISQADNGAVQRRLVSMDTFNSIQLGDSGLGAAAMVLNQSLSGNTLRAIVDVTYVRLTPTAFASLPSPQEGMIAEVNNSSVSTFGGTANGSGSSKVLVHYNGTTWTVCGN